MSVNSVNTDLFYGGQKGQNYYISQIFNNSNELISDLKLKENSPNPLGSLVMISYGEVPNSNKYKDNFDLDKKYGNLNSSIWLKLLLTSQEIANEQKTIIMDGSSSIEQNWCYVFQTSSLGVSGESVEFIDSFNIDTQSEPLVIEQPTNETEIVIDWWQNKFLEGVENNKPMISDDDFFNAFYFYYKNSENKAVSMKLSQGIIGNFYLYKNGLPTEDFTPDKIYVSIYYIRNNKKYDETKPEWNNYFFLSKISGIYSPPEEITSIKGFAYDSFAKKILLGDIATKENVANIANNSILIGENLRTTNSNINSKTEIVLGAHNAPLQGSLFTIGDGTELIPHNLFEIRLNDNIYEIYLNQEKIHPLADDIGNLNKIVANIKQIPFIADHLDEDNNYIDYSDINKDIIYTKLGIWKTINPSLKDNTGVGILLPEEQIGLKLKLLRLGTKDSYFKKVEWRLINKADYEKFEWEDPNTCYFGSYEPHQKIEGVEDRDTESTISIYPNGFQNAESTMQISTINLFASNKYFLILTYIDQNDDKISFGLTLDFHNLNFEFDEDLKLDFYTILGTYTKFDQDYFLGGIVTTKEEQENKPYNDYGCYIFPEFPVERGYVFYTKNRLLIRQNGQFYTTDNPKYTPPYISYGDKLYPIDDPLPVGDDLSAKIAWAIIKETGQTQQLKEVIQDFWHIGDMRYIGGTKGGYVVIADYNKDLAYGLSDDWSTIDNTYAEEPGYNNPSYETLPEEEPKTSFLTLLCCEYDSKTKQILPYISNGNMIRLYLDSKNQSYSPYYDCGYYNIYQYTQYHAADFLLLRGKALSTKSEIEDFIVPVYKKTCSNRNINNIQKPLIYSLHKYFIPSELEVSGNATISTLGEGFGLYAYFQTNPFKTLYPTGVSVCLRSPSTQYGGWVIFCPEKNPITNTEIFFTKLPNSHSEAVEIFGTKIIRAGLDTVWEPHVDGYSNKDYGYINLKTGPIMFCI